MYLSNLFKAFERLFESRSVIDLALNIDRLGNALTAGDYRATVSARVGYHAQKLQPYWIVLEWIIDQTFYPVDGRDHCNRAYHYEKAKGYKHRRGNDIALLLLSVVVILACILLAPIVYLVGLAK